MKCGCVLTTEIRISRTPLLGDSGFFLSPKIHRGRSHLRNGIEIKAKCDPPGNFAGHGLAHGMVLNKGMARPVLLNSKSALILGGNYAP